MEVVSTDGVYVPVQVIPPLTDSIVVNEPFTTVISALENSVTASEKVRVTKEVSPAFNTVSAIVNEDTVGASVSYVQRKLFDALLLLPVVSVNVFAATLIV